jgi:hypothetical protein
MSKMILRGLFLLVGALLAATPALWAQEEEPLSLDEEYARIAERVPGFGGLYLDERGTTHVYLQDLSLAEKVQDLGEQVEVHQGEYDFRDLYAWKDELRPLLSREEMVSLDIDEQRNRLVLGVVADSAEAFRAELASLLRDTRVPPEAVIVEAAEPDVPMETLKDTIRPVPAGVQIARQTASGTIVCTLGINVTRVGVRGFITNSHCTATRSVVEGTIFFQSTTNPSTNQIGVETVDPPFFKDGSCPAEKKCRFSDSAFVAYDSPDLSEGGNIAYPILCGLGVAGPLTVNPVLPRLPITGLLVGNPASGSVVYKIGRTTGCTFGSLTQTCVDRVVGVKVGSVVLPTNMMMLCQNRVSGVSAGGDSGSPVFRQDGKEATLLGILWGGSGGSYSYSPWIFVAGELGVFAPDAP